MKGKPSRDERARKEREERKGRRDTVQGASEKEGKNGWCTRCGTGKAEGGVGTGLMGSGARGGKLGLLCIRWVLQWRAPGTKYIS